MKDTIYREDAIKAIEELPNAYNGWSDAYDKAYIIGTLEEVPSAEREQAEWVENGRDLWECTNCGNVIYSETERDRSEYHKWCGRCGAHMKGADDE